MWTIRQTHYVQEVLNILVATVDFTQNVSVPTQNRGHILDLLINRGLRAPLTSVVGISDHSCAFFFTVKGFFRQKLPYRTVRGRCLHTTTTTKLTCYFQTDPMDGAGC